MEHDQESQKQWVQSMRSWLWSHPPNVTSCHHTYEGSRWGNTTHPHQPATTLQREQPYYKTLSSVHYCTSPVRARTQQSTPWMGKHSSTAPAVRHAAASANHVTVHSGKKRGNSVHYCALTCVLQHSGHLYNPGAQMPQRQRVFYDNPNSSAATAQQTIPAMPHQATATVCECNRKRKNKSRVVVDP